MVRSLFRSAGMLTMIVVMAIGASGQSKINPDSIRQKMQWFSDAKLGIFIHYGIYAVNGVDESWSFYNKKINYEDYMNQLKGFTASKYDPEGWAKLIHESGAKYAVITTKHHDGVALWPTKQDHYSVVKNTPVKKDLLGPFFNALDKYGIKRGAYYSLLDWSHPAYPAFMKDSNRYVIKDDPARWEKFLQFNFAQINELNQNYRPDLWWFDGDWEHSAEEWKAKEVRNSILDLKPSAIINGRLQGYGDYDTPEQNFPVSRPAYHWWELCMTINNNWGYQPSDTNWKTPFEVITIFADAIGNGGNLLLDIGPRADGTIPAEQVNVLKELGKWNGKHEEAIFGSLGGLPQGHFYGPSTYSKDSSTIYLFVPGSGQEQVVVKGLRNAIKEVRVVGGRNGKDKKRNSKPETQNSKDEIVLKHKIVGKISWSPVPGLVYIDVPASVRDKYITVLALKLDGPVSLYSGRGGLQ